MSGTLMSRATLDHQGDSTILLPFNDLPRALQKFLTPAFLDITALEVALQQLQRR